MGDGWLWIFSSFPARLGVLHPGPSVPASQPSLEQWVSWCECKENLNPVSSSFPTFLLQLISLCNMQVIVLHFSETWRINKMLLFKASLVLGKKSGRTIASFLADKLEWVGLGRCLSKDRENPAALGQGPQSSRQFSHQPLAESEASLGWQEWREGVGDGLIPFPVFH